MADNPEVDIEVSGGGTSYGIEKCASAEIDIGMASRELTSDDPELIEHEVCRDAVVIIVNLENPAAPLDLTTEQVAVIFAKDITNWSELGGKDEDIVVVSREEGSGTREFFEEEIGDISADILCESNDEVKDTVAGEPAAIGYVSSGYIEEDESAVSPVRINGVEPTMENYLCGDYPLLRSLYFLHRPPEPSPNKLIRAFMEFCLGDEGQSIIEEEGYIPIS